MKITINDLYQKQACTDSIIKYKFNNLETINWNKVKEVDVYSEKNYEDLKWLCKNFPVNLTIFYKKNKTSWEKVIYNNCNETYYETSHGYFERRTFDENNNLTYYENSKGNWTRRTFDKNNNETYYENSTGYSVKRTFDENNNETYFEDSNGYFERRTFDENNNETYFENSKGYCIKRVFDENNKLTSIEVSAYKPIKENYKIKYIGEKNVF